MIPRQLRFSAQFYALACFVAGAFFFGSTCGQRSAQGDVMALEKAHRAAFAKYRDSMTVRLLDAETERIHAERKADSLTQRSDSLAQRLQRSVPPRISIVPRDTSDMVDVCIAEEGCYPSHRRIAEVTAALDSLLHVEVMAKLIPAYDAALQAERDAKRAVAVERNLEREARRAAEARIAQLEATVAKLRPSKWDRLKGPALFVGGVILGGMVAR